MNSGNFLEILSQLTPIVYIDIMPSLSHESLQKFPSIGHLLLHLLLFSSSLTDGRVRIVLRLPIGFKESLDLRLS